MTSTPPPPPANQSSLGSSWIARCVPWLLAATALAILGWRYSPARIAEEMTFGNTIALLPYAAGLSLLSWAVVSAGDWVVISSCLKRPNFRQLLRGMAGAAVLNLFGYVAGLGAYAVWLARVAGCRIGLAGGLIVYIASSELTAVGLCAGLAAVLFSGVSFAFSGLVVIAALTVILLLLKIAQVPFWPTAWRDSPWLKPWLTISRRRATGELGLRILQIVLLTAGTWLAARAFGIDVPFAAMMSRFPIILLVAALPINVAGLGAVQGAWLLLLPWARSAEQLLAFSVLWQLSLSVMTWLRGVPFLQSELRAAVGVNSGGARIEQPEEHRTDLSRR